MQLDPYLLFNGTCAEAIKLYEQCLGAKVDAIHTFKDTPSEAHVPSEWREKIMHARLSIGGQALLASDAPPGHYEKPQGFSVCIGIDNPAEAERIFNTLAENGKTIMPFQQTFWAFRFGMLVDRFDIPWMINCEKPANT